MSWDNRCRKVKDSIATYNMFKTVRVISLLPKFRQALFCSLQFRQSFSHIYISCWFRFNHFIQQYFHNGIGGVMANVLASSTAYHGFESWSGQNHDYKICMCCFSAKHAALRRKSKELLARNQDNVSEYGDRYIRWLLFQWANTIKYKLSMLVYYKADLIIISLKINLFSLWYS